MLILTCPYCGVAADETELTPGGEAHLKRVGPEGDAAAFEGYLFGRANPKGVHYERWRHSYGCGKWFLAARDTASLQVHATYKAQTLQPPKLTDAAPKSPPPKATPPKPAQKTRQDS